jgi:uncharacterized membrane protein HdeD (DUF308 family)
MSEKKASTIPGIVLILIGLVILLNRFDIVDWYWQDIYPIGLIILGLLFFYSVIFRKNTNAVFGGTVCLLLGIFFFLRNYDLMPFYFWDEIWPVILIAFGIGFIVLYVFKPEDWGVLIPGSILLFIGLVALAHTMDLYWRTEELVEHYWPVILIVIGGGLVISSFIRKKQLQD